MNRRTLFRTLFAAPAVAAAARNEPRHGFNLAPIKREGLPIYEPSEMRWVVNAANRTDWVPAPINYLGHVEPLGKVVDGRIMYGHLTLCQRAPQERGA